MSTVATGFTVPLALAVAAAVAGCDASQPVAPNPDLQIDAGAQDAAPPPVPDCTGLDGVIGLADQVAANAGATRGKLPIVLSHGFFGFDQVGPLEYFNGAAEALREQGFAAYVTAVEPVGSSEATRGPELARQVGCIALESGAGQVNLVGHSQGGLDARVVATSEYAPYVASVTTIATPHRGTLLADAALGLVPGVADELVDAIADLFGSVVGAPEDDADFRAALVQLSEDHQAAFNAAHPDNPAIEYFSWAGRSVRTILSTDFADEACADGALPNPQARDVIDAALYLTWEFLTFQIGINDGLVPLDSAKHGAFMSCIAADHSDQIGLLAFPQTDPVSGFDHVDFYLQLAGDLESRGF